MGIMRWWREQLQFARRLRAAEAERKRKQREYYRTAAYWRSLSGRKFEGKVAAMLAGKGFQVEIQRPTIEYFGGKARTIVGDQGIDIVARKDGRKIIVQCKGTKNPVGPAVARELYGTLLASDADHAILATTAGVTKATRTF